MKGILRMYQRGATGGASMAILIIMIPSLRVCGTTHIPTPQHPVPPTPPVSVYLHRNVHKSMEMNQIVQAVSVVPKDVLLNLIATNLLVPVELYHIVTKKTVLQPTVLPVSVGQLHVLLNMVYIVLNLLVRVLLDHHVLKPMESPPIPLLVDAALKDVGKVSGLVFIVINLSVLVTIYHIAP